MQPVNKKVVVICKDSQKGYELAKAQGYLPAFTWVIPDRKHGMAVAAHWLMDIIEEVPIPQETNK